MYLYIRQVLFRTGKVLTVDISSIIQQADRYRQTPHQYIYPEKT